MAKIDIDGDGKADFSLSLSNIIMIVGFIVSGAGGYYKLNQKVEEAMKSPPIEVTEKELEYKLINLEKEFDLKLEKLEVQAMENMENLKDLSKELRDNYKRNR
jgi:hypothetical protein